MCSYIDQYMNYTKELEREYLEKYETLEKEDRKDEAILWKVRANICEIFQTLVVATNKKVTTKTNGEDVEFERIFKGEYLKMFENIPSSWRTRLTMAQKNDDILTVITEEAKLETAQKLKDEFTRLGGI